MKRCILWITACAVLLLGGCAASQPSESKEEIVMYRWVQTNTDGSERLAVYFDELFHVECKITQTELHEAYQMSDTQIVTVSDLCGSRTIDYTLCGDTLTLTFDDYTLTLKKKT